MYRQGCRGRRRLAILGSSVGIDEFGHQEFDALSVGVVFDVFWHLDVHGVSVGDVLLGDRLFE